MNGINWPLLLDILLRKYKQEMKQQTLLYLKLLGKSYWRLFREFPIVLQCLLLLVISGTFYFLAITEFSGSLTNYTVLYLLFFLAGRWACRISSSEKVLLSLLNIPVLHIRALRCILLSLPFFLLNVGVGAILLTLGTLTVVFLPERIKRNRAFPAFYVPASYQWLGMYRQSGVWTLSAGFLLLLIGLWHHNTNMVCFFLGWIILVPCFMAYYNADPPQFLTIYKNCRFLMWRKMCELVVNSTIPLLVSFILVLTVDFVHAVLYLKLTFLFVFISLLLFYSRYICYPHTLTALVLSVILIVVSFVSLRVYPLAASVVCLFLLPLLHFLAINNLKTFLAYDKN